MKDPILQYHETPGGIYVYMRMPERDLLINKSLIKDEEKCMTIKSYIDSLNFKILAYERYRKALNNLLLLARCERLPEQVIDLAQSPLEQFQDLSDFNRH